MFHIFDMPHECAGVFDLRDIKARLQINRMRQQILLCRADDMLLLFSVHGCRARLHRTRSARLDLDNQQKISLLRNDVNFAAADCVIPAENLSLDGVRHNPPDRCYHCKKEVFGKIVAVAVKESIAVVAEGSNVDDTGDYRPGMRAVQELRVCSPLLEAGLTKQDIRDLSKELGLSTWDKPSFACLASRFVYGEAITDEKLRMVDRAEQLLLELGFRQFRVRIHGNLARIELLPTELRRAAEEDIRERIVSRLREFGFSYITLDLAGYRSGSMNEGLSLS